MNNTKFYCGAFVGPPPVRASYKCLCMCWDKLSEAVRASMKGCYFADVEEFVLFLFAPGTLRRASDGEGVIHVRYTRRNKRIGATIAVPDQLAARRKLRIVADELMPYLREAVEKMIVRCRRGQFLIDETSLRRDFEIAFAKFAEVCSAQD